MGIGFSDSENVTPTIKITKIVTKSFFLSAQKQFFKLFSIIYFQSESLIFYPKYKNTCKYPNQNTRIQYFTEFYS